MTIDEDKTAQKELTPFLKPPGISGIRRVLAKLKATDLSPIHPGEILSEEFLAPFGISQNRLGRDLAIPAQRVNDIVRGKRGITVDTALRLARYFGTTAEFWLNLQLRHDLDAARVGNLPKRVEKEVRMREETMVAAKE